MYELVVESAGIFKLKISNGRPIYQLNPVKIFSNIKQGKIRLKVRGGGGL